VPVRVVQGVRASTARRSLQAIIGAGKGDVPLKDLKFRCAECGSRMTDKVMMGKDALVVQPWKADGAEPTGAAGHLRGQRRSEPG
jgi:hypothetical protein